MRSPSAIARPQTSLSCSMSMLRHAESRMQREPRKADRMEQQPARILCGVVRERIPRARAQRASPGALSWSMAQRDVDEIEKQIWETLCSRFSVLAKISNP